MGLYDGGRSRWEVAVAGIVAALVLSALAAYLLAPRPVDVFWDRDHVEPGGDAILYVVVRNTSNFVYSDVPIYVRPISPYLTVFSEGNGDPHIYVIRSLAPGASARARFLVKVSSSAYAGDHAVEVSVAFPGETVVKDARIRVG